MARKSHRPRGPGRSEHRGHHAWYHKESAVLVAHQLIRYQTSEYPHEVHLKQSLPWQSFRTTSCKNSKLLEPIVRWYRCASTNHVHADRKNLSFCRIRKCSTMPHSYKDDNNGIRISCRKHRHRLKDVSLRSIKQLSKSSRSARGAFKNN